MSTGIALGDPKARAAEPAPVRAREARFETGLDADLAAMVIGPWNRIAHEAARRFVETRGAWTRSLIVVGGEGAGKSLLLGAIERGLREAPGRRPNVTRIGCEDFLRQFTYAATHGKMAPFRQKFRSMDVLLFDDVDQLAGRRATQEEFVHIFDHLETAGRSLLLSSRARPREIPSLSRTLQSRLSAAMQVRIDPPDEAGRKNLLQHVALRDRRTLSPDILEAASKPPGSAREITDRYTRMRELASMTPAAVAAIAGAPRRQGPTLEDIGKAVAMLFGLKLEEINGTGRARRVTIPRHACFLLSKKLTEHSLQEIADFFGGRNHATVLYACRHMALAMEKDAALRGQVARLERIVCPNGVS
ncbi:MAG: AAA family ATPase [Planctomycetes bacterium]|nr:AAA family ATPase [Planctomycetota bacterium]